MPNREYEQGRDRFGREERWGRDEQQQHHQQHLVRDGEYVRDFDPRDFGRDDRMVRDARWRNEMMYQQWLDQQPRHQQQRPMGRAPKGYQRSDERIKEDLCDRLMLSWIDAENVEIQVRSGEIVLAGTVEDRQSKLAIEELADRVLGVKDVQNNIRVQQRDEDQEERSSRSSTSGSTRKPTA